ncbi:putative anthocyanidin 3-O-glucosyltransferase [Helianthus annuus]|uniref:Anthocyanidin 3-O-glucosyltransferase n=1 Tax=Helianthus annuus TaxID=4232 RepID=A0A251ULG9_HELAN|nr:anthocyanidin 3-O-glucosyltransferase 5 [Helianthus annuus]KAF5796958.1 putative anthocyanidin 3-O-glucosyltransferase [Helianthus annuus]KAJ0540206.1 putative anthocyanidin 3-O-glucosyltransferase [Helianthus annuus]KAJ0548676.1 putative anthocyanidin 3-O-glucosyltransferase [Helianthus annuus]KAJ0554950.1 putative anthocyanidin 3-O-glucosyltransferase [Helianthus annuus]KAJ0720517.1 putative anthocyanidin 3-O-glucosyltransferase [Helianthus annuus]
MSIELEGAPKPHVAFLSSPGIGHTTPLFELAFRLVTQHNFQVTFLVITNGATLAQTEYLNANPHPDLHILNLPLFDISNLVSDDMTAFVHLCVIAEQSIRTSLPSVLSRINRPKLQAFVIDIFCTGVFEACKPLSIPVYSFFTSSAAFLAFSLYLPVLDKEVKDEVSDLPDPIKVPGCHLIRTRDFMGITKKRNIDEYKWFLHHVTRLTMATGVFVNSWDDLEPVSLKALRHELCFRNMSVYPIGPVLKRGEPEESSRQVIAWLDKQPKESVLFVTLGSGGTLTSEQLTELALGLELSQQRFILVVRKPSDCAFATFFSAGSGTEDPEVYLPKGFLQRTNQVGLVVSSWAPQVAVLSHRATGAFLSHCGWNSIVECVTHGVPMIAWPMYAEQRMNATLLSDEIGVAVKMPVVGDDGETVVVGRKEIERVVRVVFEGGEGRKIRSKARELEVSGLETLSCKGSSYETLARVAESWKKGN